MGYITKDIAVITEPKPLTLSAAPNFVQFASKPAAKTFLEATVQINLRGHGQYGDFVWIPNVYWDSTGAQAANTSFNVTQNIPIDPTKTPTVSVVYAQASAAYHVFKDANGLYISGFGNGGTGGFPSPAYGTFPVPSNARFVSFSWVNASYGYTDAFKTSIYPQAPSISLLTITEPSGAAHIFHGTTAAGEVSGNTYFIAEDPADTAENLRETMLNNRWISANFEIRIAAVVTSGLLKNGKTINIKSKGTGADFNITLVAPNNTANVAYTITWINATSTSNDSISGEAGTVEIELDIYDNPVIAVDGDDQPVTPIKIGTQGPNLQKTYAGVPLWFELNALFSQYGGFNVPTASGWFDAGTLRAYRFAAKVRAVNSFTFYQSNALYVLNGYGRPSEDLDLSQYVFGASDLKLLSNKPRTPYVRGQKEYLNFIFKMVIKPNEPILGLRAIYKAYTTSDVFLGEWFGPPLVQPTKPQVCTNVLAIDTFLDMHPTAGIVRVALSREGVTVSNSQEYTIRPEGLHDLETVTFINRLGGWDTFNFERAKREEVKPDSDTYKKNVTPSFKRGDSIETVYKTTIENPVTIDGAPVSDEVAEWLKELAAASVVINGDGYYIIKDEFTLNMSQTSQNMQVPTLKYRLSETFTNG